jgi:hypothetical protein
VFENRVLRRDEVTDERRKLHNEELNYLYYWPNILVMKSIRMRWAEHVARLVGKPEGNGRLERPMCTWDDNINTDLHEVGWGPWTGLNWLRMTGGGHFRMR